jgi:hypothetical protein
MTRKRKLMTAAAAMIAVVLAPAAAVASTSTTLLPGGNLTVEGPYYDDGTNTTLTITGGSGRYAGAEGSMLLHATGSPVGSEYDFIFTLTR